MWSHSSEQHGSQVLAAAHPAPGGPENRKEAGARVGTQRPSLQPRNERHSGNSRNPYPYLLPGLTGRGWRPGQWCQVKRAARRCETKPGAPRQILCLLPGGSHKLGAAHQWRQLPGACQRYRLPGPTSDQWDQFLLFTRSLGDSYVH